MPPGDEPPFASLVAALRYRAAVQPDERAYVFLTERDGAAATLSFAELSAGAAALARRIAARVAPDDRVALLFPPGLDAVVAFYACLLAGAVAVPMMLPRRQSRRDAAAAILADCAPRLALTTRATVTGVRADLADRLDASGIAWLATDDPYDEAGSGAAFADPAPDAVAFLQYTSGSTAAPKGVIVRHANLMANLAMIRDAFANTRRSTHVCWVPLYHDMGLIVNVLQSLYVGAACVLLPPVFFVQRPLAWLRAIQDYGAEVAGGPDFAYELCVQRYRADQVQGLDLSGWKLAFNGAEPVRAATIDAFIRTFAPHGFAAQAMYPAYGMAEATVLIAADRRGAGPTVRAVSRAGLHAGRAEAPRSTADVQRAVGCGRALTGTRLAIVDPIECRRLAAGQVGEVWSAGPHLAAGYWRNPAASAATFAGRIAGDNDDTAWLRTGDLGFCDDSGALYVTGRSKDLIIIRGANHYPQDIEDTVQSVDPALRRHGGAAFSAALDDGAERLIIVQEVERAARQHLDPADLTARIREAVVREHELAPHRIVLLRPGSLPLTTSGKIQRSLARRLWQDGALTTL